MTASRSATLPIRAARSSPPPSPWAVPTPCRLSPAAQLHWRRCQWRQQRRSHRRHRCPDRRPGQHDEPPRLPLHRRRVVLRPQRPPVAGLRRQHRGGSQRYQRLRTDLRRRPERPRSASCLPALADPGCDQPQPQPGEPEQFAIDRHQRHQLCAQTPWSITTGSRAGRVELADPGDSGTRQCRQQQHSAVIDVGTPTPGGNSKTLADRLRQGRLHLRPTHLRCHHRSVASGVCRERHDDQQRQQPGDQHTNGPGLVASE